MHWKPIFPLKTVLYFTLLFTPIALFLLKPQEFLVWVILFMLSKHRCAAPKKGVKFGGIHNRDGHG